MASGRLASALFFFWVSNSYIWEVVFGQCSGVKRNNFTLGIQFDYWSSDVSWSLVDENTGLLTESGDNYARSTYSAKYNQESYCIEDGCYTLTLNDDYGDGICCDVNYYEYGWYKIWVNSHSITFENDVLPTFEGATESIYFCTNMFGIDISNNLTIIIDYDTDIDITNVSDIELDSNPYAFSDILSYEYYIDVSSFHYDTNIFTLFINDGCYEVTLFDNNDYDDYSSSLVNTQHNTYIIYMNGKIAAYGGYYTTTETNLICTNEYHTSFCVTPGINTCSNTNDLYVPHSQISTTDNDYPMLHVTATSYHFMVDASFKNEYSTGYADITCAGTRSCVENDKITALLCNAMYGCIDQAGIYRDLGKGIDASQDTQCNGIKSCQDLTFHVWELHDSTERTLLSAGAMNSVMGQVYTDMQKLWYINTTLDFDNAIACIDCEIILDWWYFWNMTGIIKISKFFSLYNAKITCNYHENYNNEDSNNTVLFLCNSDNPVYISSIDDYCADYKVKFIDCNIINNTNDSHALKYESSLTLVAELKSLIDNLTFYEGLCSNDSNFTYDIGYPLYANEELINDKSFSNICCRGYQSCAVTDTVKTNLGQILCLGSQSCASCNLLWTDDSDADVSLLPSYDNNIDNWGNIYCAALYACADSMMESSNLILCGSQYSCQNTVILKAKTLYCNTDGCGSSVIRNVETVYLIDQQTDGIILYSDGIGTSTVYFKGANSGKDITYYCNTNDVCYFECDNGACNSDSTLLYCFGKCFIKCGNNNNNNNGYNNGTDCVRIETSLAPTAAPTSAPTFEPTWSPTDNRLITEEEVDVYFNGILIILTVFMIVILSWGYCDARFCNKNQLFNIRSVFAFAFYTNDFVSDIFFIMRLYVLSFNEKGADTDIYFILFILAIIFVFLPIGINITQLHFEISKWTHDTILAETGVAKWLKSNVKVLYFLSIISGSSFSALSLCNSYLWFLPIFSMGLSSYHKRVFHKKRFISVVLFENVPQLGIQIFTLRLSLTNGNSDGSMVTILSMVFTVISILMSAFEYIFSRKELKLENIMIITMTVESMYLATMTEGQFLRKVIFQPSKIRHVMYKTLEVNRGRVERLIPMHLKNGVLFTFFVEFENAQQYQTLITKLADSVEDTTLLQELQSLYGLKGKGSENVMVKLTCLEVKTMMKDDEEMYESIGLCGKIEDGCDAVFGSRNRRRHKKTSTIVIGVKSDHDVVSPVTSSSGTHSPHATNFNFGTTDIMAVVATSHTKGLETNGNTAIAGANNNSNNNSNNNVYQYNGAAMNMNNIMFNNFNQIQMQNMQLPQNGAPMLMMNQSGDGFYNAPTGGAMVNSTTISQQNSFQE